MNHIMPYHVEWTKLTEHLAEPERSAVAEKILRTNRDAGMICVRLSRWHLDWLLPLVDKLGVARMCLFNDSGSSDDAGWWAMVEETIAKVNPAYLIIDREREKGKRPNLIKKVLDVALRYGNAEINTFCGEYHFPDYSGDVPCPEFYRIWDNSRWPGNLTPVQRIRLYQAHYPWARNIVGGRPWLCPHVDAWHPDVSPFVPRNDWKDSCRYVRDEGAIAITQYQNCGGDQYGPLTDDRHWIAAEYTHEANLIFDED